MVGRPMSETMSLRERLQLLRDLAADELTHQEVAVKWNRSLQTIEAFAGRNLNRIVAMRIDPASILGELWLSRLEDRIATYQQDIELIEGFQATSTVPQNKALAVKHRAMRNAADELGQLPLRGIRGDAENDLVQYTVEGVDVGAIAEPPASEADDAGSA